MRTPKCKAQPTNASFTTTNQMFGGSSQLPTTAEHCFVAVNCARRFDYSALASSQKLGGAAKRLIDGSEKRICRLSFDFLSPQVIERRSNIHYQMHLEMFSY